jgi:hypothetical protein
LKVTPGAGKSAMSRRWSRSQVTSLDMTRGYEPDRPI